MFNYVEVGGVVVGAFKYPTEKARIINALAPGCRPKIKKGYTPPKRSVTQSKRNRIEARQQKPRVGNYERVTYLKPGEFKL